MASLALGFVGSALGAVGGPLGSKIGGFIGATLGGLVDNMLFPQKQEGPRLDDLSVQSSAYGSVIPRIYGPQNRVTGQIIWSTGLIEHKKTTKSGGKGGPSVSTTEYTYTTSIAVLISGRRIQGVTRVLANSKAIYSTDGSFEDSGLFTAMRVYLGTSTQNPDPAIEADLGVGNAPAYRDSAYVVFEDLQLADFGNRVPNLEFFVEADASIDAEEIVKDVLEVCGFDANQQSTYGSRANCEGYVISGASSGVGALQPLAMAYNFDITENSGQISCVSKTWLPAEVVPADDYAGHDGSEDRPQAITWSRGVETDLPKTSFIQYYDPAIYLQTGSQRDDRRFGNAQNNLSTDLPLTLTADEARLVAQRALYEAWFARESAQLNVNDRWLRMRVGMSYYFETPAGLEALKIVRKTRGVNGVIELDIRRQNGEIYKLRTSGAESSVPELTIAAPGTSELILLDIPLLVDADAAKPTGFYWGVVGSGAGWRGADVYRSLTIDGSYDLFGTTGLELTVGDCDNILGAWDPESGGDLWDDEHVLTVTLRRSDMTLESVSDDEVLAGSNAAYVGPADGHDGELIGFGTATYVSPGVYELSHLLRGRKGTPYITGEHSADDMFVLLEYQALQRIDFGASDIGQERAYKAVSVLTSIDDATAVLFTNTGEGMGT